MLSSLLHAEPMLLDNKTNNIKITQHLYILEDSEKQLTLEQITTPEYSQKFIKNKTARESFGYTQSVYWAYFDITASSDQQWYLLFDYPTTGEVDLFMLSQASSTPLIPKHLKRIENYRTPLFRLNLKNQQQMRFYLRISTPKSVLRLSAKVVDEMELLKLSQSTYIFHTFILSGLAVLLIYNLFLYFSLKEPTYLALIILIAALLVILYRESNLFSALSFLNNGNNYFFSAAELIAIVAALRYWRYVNENGNVTLDRFLQILIWGYLAIIPFIGLMPVAQYWTYLFVVLISPIFIVWMNKNAWTGHKPTISIYWAGSVFILTIFPSQIAQIGLIQYTSNMIYLGHTGILLATLLLSISQAEFTRKLRIRAERLDAKNKAKDRFLTTMSHELRTPMHAVVGAGELLKQTSLSKEQSSYVKTLETASTHMLNTIDDILDFSQIEGNYLKLKPVNFQLSHLLQQMQQLFNIPATNKGLTLRINYTSPINRTLKGDATRLSQVLVNLLGNAIKYTKTGTIELSIEPQKSNSQHHAVLLFKIIDTGIGIDTQQQAKLFSPFYQVDVGTGRKFTGFGLGLSISQHLIEKMGGKLEVKSTLGKGSCFFFTLIYPLQKIPEANQLDHQQNKESPICNKEDILEGSKILLVDDDEINLFIGEHSLQKLGATVLITNNGKDAIKKVQQHSFDLIFMDISMPEMDGYETTQQIRANPNNKHLPIIALTAHTMPHERQRCIQAGMNDFLIKPFKIEELRKISKQWIKFNQQD